MSHHRTEFPHDTDRGYIDTLTELQVREVAHQIGRCRDCSVHIVNPDKFGRCEDCADHIQREVETAESRAGWDPTP